MSTGSLSPLARFATLGPVGFLPVAPGTVASVIAVIAVFILHRLGLFWSVGPATLAVCLLGYRASQLYMAETGKGDDDDPQEIVIDEVAGMMIALWPLSLGLTLAGADPTVFPWPGVVFAFVMFRALDILKPPPISWAEKAPGAKGVMFDDLLAGVLTALAATLAAGIAHGWF
ncbi:MAG: phosphatidylglycerophosphatase A [Pseudomonadota bacterium]